ncbi:hypothetical protein EC991_002715 [Linnemannia zychae]|nr:hypothetical protein EC991_002715 [Linnemannia zychae]
MDGQIMHARNPTIQNPVYPLQAMHPSSQDLIRNNSANAASVSPTLSTISTSSYITSPPQTNACSPQTPYTSDPSPTMSSNHPTNISSFPAQLTGSHRRRLTPEETEYLLRQYHANEKPTTKDRLTFAAHLNLHPRTIQVWFQNRRAKLRREITLVGAIGGDAVDDDYDSSHSDTETARESQSYHWTGQQGNNKMFPEDLFTSSSTHKRVEDCRGIKHLAWNQGAHCGQGNPDGLTTVFGVDRQQPDTWCEGNQAVSVRGCHGSEDDKPIIIQTVSQKSKTLRSYKLQARQLQLPRPRQEHPTDGYCHRLKGHAKGLQSLIPRQQRAFTLVHTNALV